MQLNLPILDLVANSRNILIAGAGGGYDVYVGLPLYFTLRALGKNVHLANYSFCDVDLASRVSQVEVIMPGLLANTIGGVTMQIDYLVEPYLAQWFQEVRGETIPIWMLADTGALPLTEAYQKLVEHLQIDAIILVDGGVDSLMRGNEEGAGSLLEDTISLIAVGNLDVPVKLLASIGFGAETEEGVCHYNALENMAALVKDGAFRGSCALTPDMEAFQLYADACQYVWEQPSQHPSHISTRIIPAVQGEFGNFHLIPFYRHTPLFISPLMSLYWFFDAAAVLRRNLIADLIRKTTTKEQAFIMILKSDERPKIERPRRVIPY
ncbi:MAG TPA: DUF1152 domain-containing protein [Phototrophicaceae bacterium]|nr:DUF1152 domain-containing protein [Phototrophicaceae bacterium]